MPAVCDNCQNHWPNSTLFNLLKDTFSVANYKNTVNFKIYLGTTSSYSSYTHDDLYKMERSLESKGNAGPNSNGVTSYMGSVGLIYPTDYVYAVLESDCARTTMTYNYDITSACHENNWLYQGSSNFQWLITPYEVNGTYAFSVHSNGGVNEADGYDVIYSGIYSPVMALKADVVVTGSGTNTDPYIMQ